MYVNGTYVTSVVDTPPISAAGFALATIDGAASFDDVRVQGVSTRSYYMFGGARVAERATNHGVSNGAGPAYQLHGDHLGSVGLATGASGAEVTGSRTRYLPFGDVRGTAPTGSPTDFAFTAMRGTSFGLTEMGARWYSSAVGRWLSPDTIVPNQSNPQGLNRYGYVLNNPLRYRDPTGHKECEEYCDEASETNTPTPTQSTTPSSMTSWAADLTKQCGYFQATCAAAALWLAGSGNPLGIFGKDHPMTADLMKNPLVLAKQREWYRDVYLTGNKTNVIHSQSLLDENNQLQKGLGSVYSDWDNYSSMREGTGNVVGGFSLFGSVDEESGTTTWFLLDPKHWGSATREPQGLVIPVVDKLNTALTALGFPPLAVDPRKVSLVPDVPRPAPGGTSYWLFVWTTATPRRPGPQP